MKYRAIEKNKGRFLTIMYDVNFGKSRLRGKTNLSINRDCIKTFNPLSLRTTQDFTQSEKLQILGKLNDFELFLEGTKARLKSENLANVSAELKEQIEIYFGRTKEQESEKKLSFFEFMDYYTDLTKGKVYTKNGIKKTTSKYLIWEYKGLKKLLKKYVDEKKISFGFQNINQQFYNDFNTYCENEGYKTNTIGKHFKNIKLFMGKAHNDGHHDNLKYKGFKVLKEKVDNEYLNVDELAELFQTRHDLSSTDLPKIDYFLLMAYTSLRVADILKLRRKNIIFDEIPLIEFLESKNAKPIYFQITPEVQTLLDYYDGGFPNDVIKQKVNKGIAINDVLKKVIKHKKITCHCGRRSYVNNEIIKGTSYDDIIRQTNHSNRESFNHYVSQSSDRELLKARARREFEGKK